MANLPMHATLSGQFGNRSFPGRTKLDNRAGVRDRPPMMKTLIMVALGGSIGASLRFLWGVSVLRLTGPTELPLAIMAANIVGSFLMGAFVVLAAHRGLTHLAPFVMTGILGGFTTFSAFSLESVTLIERGNLGLAGVYMALSVGLSIMGLIAGLWLMRMVLL